MAKNKKPVKIDRETPILAEKITIQEPIVKKPRINRISIGKFIVTLIFLVLLFFDFYYIGLFKGTCDSSTCFSNALAKCKPVKFTNIIDNNFYEYNIYSSFSDKCTIKITLEKVAPGSNQDIKTFLEGKTMICKIPKEITKAKTFNDIENVLDYCHGELKEGVYQVILKRMYSLVISDLDEVIKQATK